MIGVLMIAAMLPQDSWHEDLQKKLADLQKPEVSWSQTASSGDVIYLVTETWCAPCRVLKANLAGAKISYQTLTLAEHEGIYGSRPAQIPHLFVPVKGNPKKRYVFHGDIRSPSALTQWSSGFKSESVAICEVNSEMTPAKVLSAIATHVTQSQKLYGGLLDIEVPLDKSIRELITELAYKESISFGKVTLSWKKVSFEIAQGRLKFHEPIKVQGKSLGVTVTAAVTAMKLSPDGRTLDVEIDGFVDLRVVFKE